MASSQPCCITVLAEAVYTAHVDGFILHACTDYVQTYTGGVHAHGRPPLSAALKEGFSVEQLLDKNTSACVADNAQAEACRFTTVTSIGQ